MPFFYYYDPYYWMILIPAMLIALVAQIRVSATFRRYSRLPASRGLTGAQAAEAVLRAHGVYDVAIERVRGNLTDHYDPRANVIRLSDSVYSANSVAAVGVAAHEAGPCGTIRRGIRPHQGTFRADPAVQYRLPAVYPVHRHWTGFVFRALVRHRRHSVRSGGAGPVGHPSSGVQRLAQGHRHTGERQSAGGWERRARKRYSLPPP